ncbi:MAG: sugar ABC transporter permease [Epulopiscium sp.]|nr:sugar ABC transporter permease [Candidatus Epulonipiscium sp.]
MMYKDKKIVWIFLAPTLILVVGFLYYPFVLSIYNSFFNVKDLGGISKTYIGLGNYREMFRDRAIWTSLKNTLILTVAAVVFQAGLGLVLALLVDSVRRGQQFYRTVFFFPIVISATAIGLMFNLMYSYDYGMFNQLLMKMGKDKVLWLDEAKAMLMVSVPVIWQYVGFYFVIILTGITGIPKEIYESAAIDGVTGFKQVFYITIPLLSGVIKSCMILAITGALKVFDLPWVIANKGAPSGKTYLLGTYQYNVVFNAARPGYGSAIAVLIVLLGVIISVAVNTLLTTEDDDGY